MSKIDFSVFCGYQIPDRIYKPVSKLPYGICCSITESNVDGLYLDMVMFLFVYAVDHQKSSTSAVDVL